jgi:hypothetical protein
MPNQIPLPLPLDQTSDANAETKTPKRTPEQQWLAWAAMEWAQAHQSRMTVRWARDLALIRPLLRLHGEEELKRRWVAFLTTMDQYFARRGWDIPSFSVAIDRYLGNRDRVPLVRLRQLHEEEASCRDPLTGIDLRLNRFR